MTRRRDQAASPLDGLLLVDKGMGLTSFGVVAHLRRALRVPKVGHGGTLDPMATGVLPILLGEATKLTSHLQGQDKEYVATVHLGVTTDSLDSTGRVTGESPVPALEAGDIRGVLGRFEGEIEQVPPMFSALHAGGRRLHELARAGIEVARAARCVRIHAIELLEWAAPRLRVQVRCGKGTYIRSLAADLGAALGCGAHLAALERTRLGPFRLADALPWDVVRSGDPALLRGRVRPPDDAVSHLPAVHLPDEAARRLLHGQRLLDRDARQPSLAGVTGVCRVYWGETFVGLGEAGPQGLSPLRLLHADHPRARPVSH